MFMSVSLVLRSLVFRSLAFLFVRFCFAPFLSLSPYLALWQGLSFLGVPSGQIVFARSLSRSFVSVSLALRLVVFRSLDFPLVCLFRWPCARSFSFARFPVCSCLFRPPCARSFFVCSLSRSFVLVSLARFLFVLFPARSFLFRSPCARSYVVRSLSRSFVSVSLALRSFLFRSLEPHPSLCPLSCAFRCSFMFLSFGAITPTPLCAPFLVRLDVHLYICLFLSSAR